MRAKVAENPLKQIAIRAGPTWTVDQQDENTLVMHRTWPTYSALSLGWTTNNAELTYYKGQLRGRFYLRIVSLFYLFIPSYVDTGDGFYGLALKPTLREEMDEVLRWGGVNPARATYTKGSH